MAFGKQLDKRKGKFGCSPVVLLVLFALPFAAVGTFTGYLASSSVITWVRAKSWEEVPARIISADLDASSSDGSTTYRVRAAYEYEYGGRRYSSERVSSGGGSDNIGSFHQDKYAELRLFVDSGRPFRCFVNPDDPSEALLYRELRWGMLGFMLVFTFAFGIVGYGLMFAAVYGNRIVKEEDKLKAARPEEPWAWNADWADGTVTAGSWGTMIGALLFATLWNLISAPMLFIVPREWQDGNALVLIGLLFPLIGLGLAAFAVHAVLRWRKFGNSEFEMYSMPGVLGGYLEGRINTNIRVRGAASFRLTLSCTRKETSGSGKNRSTTRRTIWQDIIEVPATALLAGRRGVSVPVRFAIPYDAGPETDEQASAPIDWRLEVAAPLPGVDFSTDFSVPVFRTPDSDPEFQDDTPEAAIADDPDTPAELESLGIVRTPTPAGGVQYVFRRARALGSAVGLTVFTIVWCGCIWLMLDLDAPLVFPIVFGIFALLLLAGLVELWLKQTRVEVANGRLAFNQRLVGPGKTRMFAADEISRIAVKSGMQSGDHLFYQLVLHDRQGKKHALGSRIRGQRLARRIVDDLQEALAS